MAKQSGVTTKAQAVETAMRFTGLNRLQGTTVTAQRETVAENKTPYLSNRIVNRQLWRVEIQNAVLKLKSGAAEVRDPYVRSFEVLIAEDTGELLGVDSSSGADVSDLRPRASAKVAENQLREQGEIYAGFPPGEPRITFLDALDLILAKGVGSPYLAREIHASYVLHSDRGAKAHPVWVITMRGLPPRQAHGPGGDAVPVWQRDHMRNVVDAESGVVLFATNTPHPQ